MLEIIVPSTEMWDEFKEEFVYTKEQTLRLEHSLVAISKWESKWKKPFLSKKEKTYDETIDYVKCMTITQNVNPKIYKSLSSENFRQIGKYIDDPMSATFFVEEKRSSNHEQITSELIYYWMIKLGIPVEFQKWHLNRLLMLIQVFNIKDQPPKKMSRTELMSRNARINAERKKKLNTKG